MLKEALVDILQKISTFFFGERPKKLPARCEVKDGYRWVSGHKIILKDGEPETDLSFKEPIEVVTNREDSSILSMLEFSEPPKAYSWEDYDRDVVKNLNAYAFFSDDTLKVLFERKNKLVEKAVEVNEDDLKALCMFFFDLQGEKLKCRRCRFSETICDESIDIMYRHLIINHKDDLINCFISFTLVYDIVDTEQL